MKTLLLSIFTLLSLFVQSQDHVKLALQKYENTLSLGIMPTFNIDGGFGIFTAVMTIRWETQEGVQLVDWSTRLAHDGLEPMASMWFINTATAINGIYSYKTVSISGSFYESDIEIPADQVTSIILIDFINENEGCVTFEVVDDQFQAENGVSILSDRMWWCSILYPPMNFPGGFGDADATFPYFEDNRYVEGMSSVQDGDCLPLSIQENEQSLSPVLFILSESGAVALNRSMDVAYISVSDAAGRVVQEFSIRGGESILLDRPENTELLFVRVVQGGATYGLVLPNIF
jgi:hypothetical protein